MLKKFLLILSVFCILPCFAGEYQNAINNNNRVFLYLYTPECGYCNKFNPIYQKTSKKYQGKCKFFKMNALDAEGSQLARSFGIRYVPYVVMINPKKKSYIEIKPYCLLDNACIDQAISKFVN